MKVLVAGATGAIGRRLLPQLRERGHDVAALVRSERSATLAARLSATAFAADALDRRAVLDAVDRWRPEVVVNQLTALKDMTDLRDFRAGFAATNELRTRGTANLIDAARSAGARRVVSQGYGGWPLARVGGPVKDETDPLDEHPPPAFRETFDALAAMERAVLAFPSGVVLRYGTFYGPGSSLAPGGSFFADVAGRRVPLIGEGGGMFSFIHLADAASATVAAIEGSASGVFHVADDEPAPVRTWLPFLASLLGARPPHRLPAWLARWIVPEHLRILMTAARGCSNAKVKRTFAWAPRFATWREGFRETLAALAGHHPNDQG